jgi:hypothetical protein
MRKKVKGRQSHASAAKVAKRIKQRMKPDNEPKSSITIIENGCSFSIPLTGRKGRWDWEKISDNMLRKIIQARIKERGITSRAQLARSKPNGSAIEKNANKRGILDEILPAKKFGREKKKETYKPQPKKPSDPERHAENRRIVIEWMEDDEWWDNLGKNNNTSDQ